MTFAEQQSFKTSPAYLPPIRFVKLLSFNHPYYLFLDIDGTLAEFTLNPKDSFIPQSTLDLLQSIQRHGVVVAAVTGRSLVEAKKMLSPIRLPIAATHGLEIDLASTSDTHHSVTTHDATVMSDFTTNHTSQLNDIKQTLTHASLPYQGLTVEDKPYSSALHYRQHPKLENTACAIMTQTLASYPDWEIKRGKYVLEAVLKGINKGSAITTLLDVFDTNNQGCAIFIGDDVTDEAGFKTVQERNFTESESQLSHQNIAIKVGSDPTYAQYHVNSIDEVAILLKTFLEFLQSRSNRAASSENLLANDQYAQASQNQAYHKQTHQRSNPLL